MAESVPPSHIVVFGRPGSGKSSLAERLGEAFGFRLIRTGELLRAAIRRGDFLGQRVDDHLARGNLVPDSLIVELLEHSLQAPGTEKLLFDGFPRTMGQVPLLEQFERTLGFRIGAYLEIALDRAVAVARMTGRRVCPVCGATYHLLSRPPAVPDRCDLDGAALEGRKDDAAEVVDVRQQIYDEHALPILAYYREHAPGRFLKVDGSGTFPEVFAATCRALGLEPPAGV